MREIKVKIAEDGVNRSFFFFYAIIPMNGELKNDGVDVVEIKINTCKIQPVEGWRMVSYSLLRMCDRLAYKTFI